MERLPCCSCCCCCSCAGRCRRAEPSIKAPPIITDPSRHHPLSDRQEVSHLPQIRKKTLLTDLYFIITATTFFAFASVFLPFTNYSSLLFELFYTLLHLLCAASPVFKLSSEILFINLFFSLEYSLLGKFPCFSVISRRHFRFPPSSSSSGSGSLCALSPLLIILTVS